MKYSRGVSSVLFSPTETRKFVACLHEPGLTVLLIAGAGLDEPLTKALRKLQFGVITHFCEKRALFLLLRC